MLVRESGRGDRREVLSEEIYTYQLTILIDAICKDDRFNGRV